MTYIYGRDNAYNYLLRYVLYAKHIIHRVQPPKKSVPTTTSESVFEEVPKVVLTNCVDHHCHLMEVILMPKLAN